MRSMCGADAGYLSINYQSLSLFPRSGYRDVDAQMEKSASGYGYCLCPYATAYRSALCTTQIRILTVTSTPESRRARATSSLIRNNPTLAPYSRFMSRALWWPYGG